MVSMPDMVRVVVAVDPSGSDDVDNADNDEIGIVVVGLGTDGNAYLIEDCTVKAGPATWGRVATECVMTATSADVHRRRNQLRRCDGQANHPSSQAAHQLQEQ